MRLFITASQSLSLALSKALPVGGDCCDEVIWCDGRLLELCEPDFYDSRWAKWDVTTLPIKVPFEKWHLTPRLDKKTKLIDPYTKIQLEAIENSLKRVSMVVNVGNPNSEGPFLIDELIDHFGYRGQVMRLLLDAKDIVSVEKIEASMQNRSEYRNEYLAELCRSRANWLVGKNMSRAVTKLLARDQLISIGRIQTPMLALVVRHCIELENKTGTPEKPFTKRTLINEMRFFARCGVHDIDALKSKGFIELDGKTGQIKDTALGRSLILALPEQLTDTTVTMAWENALADVAKGDYPPEEFMRRIDIFVEKRLQEIKALAGKVAISISQGTPEPQSHQEMRSSQHAHTANRSTAATRGRHVSKPSH